MKKNKLFPLSLLALVLVPSMTGCSTIDETINLRVFNCEDYIDEENLLPKFVEEYEAAHPGESINVIYDTYDTNETMLSSLKTGKSSYDLIVASDYAIQKMMQEDMLLPLDYDKLDNYVNYCSPYLFEQMQSITAPVPNEEGVTTQEQLSKYSIGYMWGTLGLVYNPGKISEDKGYEDDKIKLDMNDWSNLWNSEYELEALIKDSMRDTYSVGVMETYKDEIVRELNNSGYFDEHFNLKEGCYEDALTNYTPVLAEIFNRCDKETTLAVQDKLLELRENIYGFECDSGKNDMVKGAVGINLAWSGDAVYSIDKAENETGIELYYSVPKTGGNIWLDGWTIPKGATNIDAAHEFLNFMSSPENALMNMDYVGYTSFIGGDDVLNLIREWYDPRTEWMYVWHDVTEEEIAEDPDLSWEDSYYIYDEDENLVYLDGTGEHEDGDDYGAYDMTGSTYEAPICKDPNTQEVLASTWDEFQDLLIQEGELEEKWAITDLTYMFKGSLEEYDDSEFGDDPTTNAYLFFNGEAETIVDEETGESVIVGRQFAAQYPDNNMIPKLAVMRDFGSNNYYVLQLWENVKSNTLPTWAIITFILLILIAGGLIGGYYINKSIRKKIRIERRKQTAC